MKRDPQKTQELILEAATKRFAVGGMAGARVDEIASDSGVNKRMIYHYFGDKQGLYAKVLQVQMQQMFRDIRKPRSQTVDEQIREAIEAYFDYCRSNPAYISIMQWEMVSKWSTLNSMAEEVGGELYTLLIEIINGGIREGVFHAETDARLFITLATIQVFCFFPMLYHPNLLHEGTAVPISEAKVEDYKKKVVDQIMRSLEP
ncbi:TetR/AcrR family transcriptional regulator [Bacillus horti]|uniref:TetR/AcrR family transcriptional regulator n=1 Tax=Caldalkalibacillus horti TaxID=77523 RepID=A0ABT9W3Z2_9BACI|nr:TetR/AcrR family transcriptional regulator [Bacillus horti]MDQ0167952.1 TetR/AcrR family transcriptional regulator [Bacillus horti]